MPKSNRRCQVGSSNTKVSNFLLHLAKRVSAKIVTLVAHVAENSYLSSINVAVLHHGENTAEHALERSDTALQLLELDLLVLQALELLIVTLEAFLVLVLGGSVAAAVVILEWLKETSISERVTK